MYLCDLLIRIKVELTFFCTMKLFELLKISSPALKMLSNSEAARDDWRYVKLYEDFQNMRRLGVKYAEVVRRLAESYGIGRATVERVVARLGRDVKP